METTSTLHFEWDGSEEKMKKLKEPELQLFVNNELCVNDWNYQDGFNIEIPISGTKLLIEIKIGKKNSGKSKSYFKHEFDIEAGTNYYALLSGNADSLMGLKLKLSKPNEIVGESDPACYNNFPITMMSYCFPIYGIYTAVKASYNRIAALSGAALGLIVAFILSNAASSDYETLAFGFGKLTLFEYEPFSLVDWIINILIGGIASIRGLLYLLLEGLFS